MGYWCAWFQGDPKPDGDGFAKVPIGNHSDPKTWCTFDELCAKLTPSQGIGYNFHGGDLHPLDLDHVRNPQTGHICPEAMLLLSRLKTFSEYSISGRGLHVIFKGNVRGKQLGETCVQYWNPAKAPRFFTVTGDVVGDAFNTIKEVGDEFNYIFATARHISAKCREELATVDPAQFAKLPAEPVRKEDKPRAKSSDKKRQRHPDFNMEDFLSWAGLTVDNVTDNTIGKCYRLTTCPIKGEKHVGQNSTSTNFILSNDGGLGFHCQSTGCVEYGFNDALKLLEENLGKYPGKLYDAKADGVYKVEILSHRASTIKSKTWDWIVPGYLPKGAEVYLFAGKGRGKTKVCNYFNKLANDQGWRVIRFNIEDPEAEILKPTMYAAGCNLDELTEVVDRQAIASQDGQQMPTSIDFSRPECVNALEELVNKFGDVGLVIIEPINNYKGKSKAISEDDMRPIHTALATLAEKLNICILVVSHTNRKKDVDIQEKAHGAGSGINVARVNLYLEKDPDGDPDERILADAGSNIKVGKSIVFRIVEQPPFELDGVTHKEIAIAVFDRETETTAQDMLTGGESPTVQSQARDIATWLIEYLTDKGEVRKDVVIGAAKQFNKDWTQANIEKTFHRRLKKTSQSRSVGGGKTKTALWSLGKKEQTLVPFDGSNTQSQEMTL